MRLLSILFLASLMLGQAGGISLYPGIVVYVHDVLLVVLFIEGFVQYALRSKFTVPRLIGPIMLFILAAVLSLLTNSGRFAIPTLGISALYLVRWIFYAALYVLVRQAYTKIQLWLRGLFITGVGLGVLGLTQFFLYPDLRNLTYLGWDPHYYRVFSTFLDPNFAGIYFVMTILLGIFLVRERKIRLWVIPGMCISLISLLLTYSRSSYLALISAVIVFTILKRQWILAIGVAVFITTIIFLPKTSGSTLFLFRTDSSLARLGNWQAGLALSAQAPVFGHGFNTLRYISGDNGSAVSKAASGLDSSILFVTATSGIVGLFAFGYLIQSQLKLGFMLMKRQNFTILGTLYISGWVALGVHSLFVNSAFYPWILIWFWILAAVLERIISGDRSLSS